MLTLARMSLRVKSRQLISTVPAAGNRDVSITPVNVDSSIVVPALGSGGFYSSQFGYLFDGYWSLPAADTARFVVDAFYYYAGKAAYPNVLGMVYEFYPDVKAQLIFKTLSLSTGSTETESDSTVADYNYQDAMIFISGFGCYDGYFGGGYTSAYAMPRPYDRTTVRWKGMAAQARSMNAATWLVSRK